jgi:hypothetical protein
VLSPSGTNTFSSCLLIKCDSQVIDANSLSNEAVCCVVCLIACTLTERIKVRLEYLHRVARKLFVLTMVRFYMCSENLRKTTSKKY